MAKKKRSFFKKFILSLLIVLLIIGAIGAYWAYRIIFQPNVFPGEKKSELIYIPTGSNFTQLVDMLVERNIIKNRATFEWLAEKKNLPENLKPGRYRVLRKMTNNQLVNLLRAGMQEPVNITFNNIRTKNQLVTRVCLRLEADSMELFRMLNDDEFLQNKYGLTGNTVMSLFIPDTYTFYWNTSAEEFLDKMAKIYKDFWTSERKNKAAKLGLTQAEVCILASIVQGEQWKYNDEKAVIAGLYLNRLKMGMPLQSDPTLIFASGDFTIVRVLNADKNIDSPYNTYKRKGLPPGPIILPDKSSIDAVLNYKANNYIYMCAKEDFSGRHNFSKTYAEHQVCARKYQKALNVAGIKR
jgi:UPF0755 protein